jgi:hypothetical protein
MEAGCATTGETQRGVVGVAVAHFGGLGVEQLAARVVAPSLAVAPMMGVRGHFRFYK